MKETCTKDMQTKMETKKQICRHKKRPTYIEIFGEKT